MNLPARHMVGARMPSMTPSPKAVATSGKAGSEAMSLLQEMKLKQEQRERRKRLKEELEALGREAAACGQGDVGRMCTLQQELSAIEGFLTRVDGPDALQAMPAWTPPVRAEPACVREDQESANLYIGSLAPTWTEELMTREFGRFGKVVSVKIMYPRTGRQHVCGMSTGFVQFATRQQAEVAKAKMAGQIYFGMALRIEFSKPVTPTVAPTWAPGQPIAPGMQPYTARPMLALPADAAAEAASAQAGPEAGRRRSKFDMAKTFSVVIPADESVKRLIDITAGFVSIEGWDFEKLLMDRERSNPRFDFLLSGDAQSEDPLNIYYRWKTFSLLQGDTHMQWRMEPFQIYVNGPMWQPPACEKPAEVIEIEVPAKPAIPRIDFKKKLGGGAGSADLSPAESHILDKLIASLVSSERRLILEAMVFCLDNAAASQTIANRIYEAIIQAHPELTHAEVSARLHLLSDVLYNAHCSRPGAAAYRRQFQEHLPDIFERLRDICDSASEEAAAALRETSLALIRTWAAWSSFPRQFTQGLEATLCQSTSEETLKLLRWRWRVTQDLPTLERECRSRGLSTKGALSQLVDRLIHYETYCGEQICPNVFDDPELDGDLLEDGDLVGMEEELAEWRGKSSIEIKSSAGILPGSASREMKAVLGTLGAGLASCRSPGQAQAALPAVGSQDEQLQAASSSASSKADPAGSPLKVSVAPAVTAKASPSDRADGQKQQSIENGASKKKKEAQVEKAEKASDKVKKKKDAKDSTNKESKDAPKTSAPKSQKPSKDAKLSSKTSSTKEQKDGKDSTKSKNSKAMDDVEKNLEKEEERDAKEGKKQEKSKDLKREDTKEAKKVEKKDDKKVESEVEKKVEKKAEKKAEEKVEKKVEKKAEEKVERKAEKKVERKAEKKVEQQVEKKAQKKVEKKAEKKMEQKEEGKDEKKMEQTEEMLRSMEKSKKNNDHKKVEKKTKKKVEKRVEKNTEKHTATATRSVQSKETFEELNALLDANQPHSSASSYNPVLKNTASSTVLLSANPKLQPHQRLVGSEELNDHMPPKKRRRRPAIDLGSMLDNQIAQVQAEVHDSAEAGGATGSVSRAQVADPVREADPPLVRAEQPNTQSSVSRAQVADPAREADPPVVRAEQPNTRIRQAMPSSRRKPRRRCIESSDDEKPSCETQQKACKRPTPSAVVGQQGQQGAVQDTSTASPRQDEDNQPQDSNEDLMLQLMASSFGRNSTEDAGGHRDDEQLKVQPMQGAVGSEGASSMCTEVGCQTAECGAAASSAAGTEESKEDPLSAMLDMLIDSARASCS